jgi:PilZ domain-containing protein
MSDDQETIAMRPSVIDGVRQDDDYEVIWRGLPIGRIMKEPTSPHWWWACNVYGQPPTPNDRGPGINFKDCQVRFKLAWARIRPTLTEQVIAVATRHAEGLAQGGQAAPDRQPNQEAMQVLENNRAAPRQRVLKSGVIEFNGGTIDCVVRNLSQTGAALEVASPVGIPPEFNLLMSGDRAHQHCKVVWRKDKRIGVRFGSG